MKTLVVAIDWYGPYPSKDAMAEVAESEGTKAALYIGWAKNQNAPKTLEYVGISKEINWRMWNWHPTLDSISDLELWGGIVTSHEAAGRKGAANSMRHSRSLDYAETVLIHALHPRQNKSKTASKPTDPCMIISRWFAGVTPFERCEAADPNWPDFIEYDPVLGLKSGRITFSS